MKKHPQQVDGFSKWSKEEKIDWLAHQCFSSPKDAKALLTSYWHSDAKLQQLHDEFIENAVSNFYLPLGLAPNFVINGQNYVLPMVTEESSVVAAASHAAKFWAQKGGFHAEVLGTEKVGQVHFMYKGSAKKLARFFTKIQPLLLSDTDRITEKMKKRGGGITDISLVDKTADLPHYFQLHVCFETADAMGANFINSCLEQMAQTLKREAQQFEAFDDREKKIDVVMSILSNHVPNCRVRASVSCAIESLGSEGDALAQRFVDAVRIAQVAPHRAVTHNKGIMNGIDAVAIATGNDFRAIEAGAHAYAAKSGAYSSLSEAWIKDDFFGFALELPLAVGTVGGLTQLHPLVRWSHELLGQPDARTLMQIMAVAGLAQNFAAVRSLVTTGIQQGHMKMHLQNILNQLGANMEEKIALTEQFKTQTVSYAAVEQALQSWRKA
jgi:hydroxymethylglutaryl-CoA reductase